WRMGDEKNEQPGFQPQFEKVFEEIYGLTNCRLGAYFDDVQIQHVPQYAYGEEIAVLVEQTTDRLSLTHSFHRFSTSLASGQLPWASPSAPDDNANTRQQADYRDTVNHLLETIRPGDPEFVATYDKLAGVLRGRGDLPEAARIYRDALYRLERFGRPGD